MKIIFHRRCDKDLERLKKAGWNMEPFEQLLRDCEEWPLPAKYEAHLLAGDKEGIWDIHIRQNWIVFLKKKGSSVTLLRTGTHANFAGSYFFFRTSFTETSLRPPRSGSL